MNKVYFYDVEIFTNFFCITFKRLLDSKLFIFEISERVNDYNRLKAFLGTSKKEYYMVGFNSIHYDNVILRYMFKNDYSKSDYLEICKKTKEFSDLVINDNTDFELLKPYKWNSKQFILNWTDVDLFLYWSKGLRISKKLSLKSLGIFLNYHTVQELPYAHNSIIKLDMIQNIIDYNLHDVNITELLYKALNEELGVGLMVTGTIKLREGIKEFNAMSYDTPKIASETLLFNYCKKTNQDVKVVRNQRKTRQNFKFGEHLPNINFKTKLFQDLYTKVCNSENTFSDTLIVNFKQPIKISYGVGGVHSVNKDEQYNSDSNNIVLTSDVTSLYPRLIELFNAFHDNLILEDYLDKKKLRVETIKPKLTALKKDKNASKEDLSYWKNQDAFAKLILNGISGILDSEFSWLFNNIPINTLRVYGQLMLSRLVEECYLADYQVVSINTKTLVF